MNFIPYKYDASVAVIFQLLSSNFFQDNFSEIFLTSMCCCFASQVLRSSTSSLCAIFEA